MTTKSDTRKILKIILISTICVIILGYIAFNSRLLIAGPQIEDIFPSSGSSFDKPVIEITGNAKNISFISLNDNPIFIDEEGKFEEKLLLSPGLSIIKLYGRDRFDRETTKYLQYVYNGEIISVPEEFEIETNASSSEEDLESGTSSTSSEEEIN